MWRYVASLAMLGVSVRSVPSPVGRFTSTDLTAPATLEAAEAPKLDGLHNVREHLFPSPAAVSDIDFDTCEAACKVRPGTS